jgi:hypothetical protein
MMLELDDQTRITLERIAGFAREPDDLLRAARATQRTRFEGDVRGQLDATIAELGAEEVMVLAILARRLLEGQRVYGRLALADDPRDLEAERGDEIADVLVYGAMAELKRILAGTDGR